MSWVISIWAAAVGACVTLAAAHLLLWCWDRSLRASLWFAGVAGSVAVMGGLECAIMWVRSPEEFYLLHHWGHVTFFFTVVCVIGFVQSYFRTGRPWLIGALVGARALILMLAFVPGPTFNFREVTALVPYEFLGATLRSPRGIPTPWEHLGNLSGLLLLWFVVDAAIRLWRKGNDRERQRAVVVAAGVVLFVLSCATNGFLVHHTGAQIPYFITLSFIFIVTAMAVELSRDLLNAAHLAAEVRENAESMRLAASATQLALWRWDIAHDIIWVSPDGRGLYGIPPGECIRLQRFLETVHADDRESTRLTVQRALEGNGDFRSEYRVVLPEGEVRWIGARGKVEFSGARRAVRMLGVSIDITERKASELEAAQHREQLSHLTRVAMLGELSGSLAHELNQPLTSILSNAQAALRFLNAETVDHDELREILKDIADDDQRAGEIIRRLRTLVKRGEVQLQPLDLNDVVRETLRLVRSDLVTRNVALAAELAPGPLLVKADRVQLQQVFLNLILNGCDAMAGNASEECKLAVRTRQTDTGGVQMTVVDCGHGIPVDQLDRIFDSFVSTKSSGLGLGLAISRGIVEAHGGTLQAANNVEGGASFSFVLPPHQSGPT